MKTKVVYFSILATLLITSFANASEIKLKGVFEQGGIIIGQSDNTKNVTVNGERKYVSDNGEFIVGIGRDYDGDIKIKTDKEEKTVKIAKKEWGIQKINGIKKNKVNPSKEDSKKIAKEFKYIKDARKEILYNNYFDSGFILPIEGGVVSGEFGNQRILNGEPKNPHSGTDIAANNGTTIMASADGIVSLAKNDLFYTGNVVMIDHGLSLQTIYAHMDKILVKEGQMVKKGDKIGTVGATGRATGPHLHWGASVNNIKINPMNLVKIK